MTESNSVRLDKARVTPLIFLCLCCLRTTARASPPSRRPLRASWRSSPPLGATDGRAHCPQARHSRLFVARASVRQGHPSVGCRTRGGGEGSNCRPPRGPSTRVPRGGIVDPPRLPGKGRAKKSCSHALRRRCCRRRHSRLGPWEAGNMPCLRPRPARPRPSAGAPSAIDHCAPSALGQSALARSASVRPPTLGPRPVRPRPLASLSSALGQLACGRRS